MRLGAKPRARPDNVCGARPQIAPQIRNNSQITMTKNIDPPTDEDKAAELIVRRAREEIASGCPVISKRLIDRITSGKAARLPRASRPNRAEIASASRHLF
jgi:hypothetical protein